MQVRENKRTTAQKTSLKDNTPLPTRSMILFIYFLVYDFFFFKSILLQSLWTGVQEFQVSRRLLDATLKELTVQFLFSEHLKIKRFPLKKCAQHTFYEEVKFSSNNQKILYLWQIILPIIFQFKYCRKDKTVCWNCTSTDHTLLTDLLDFASKKGMSLCCGRLHLAVRSFQCLLTYNSPPNYFSFHTVGFFESVAQLSCRMSCIQSDKIISQILICISHLIAGILRIPPPPCTCFLDYHYCIMEHWPF